MIEFHTVDFPYPENEVLFLEVQDLGFCYGACVSNDFDWIIQIPFEDPIIVTSTMIKRWAKIPKSVKNES